MFYFSLHYRHGFFFLLRHVGFFYNWLRVIFVFSKVVVVVKMFLYFCKWYDGCISL